MTNKTARGRFTLKIREYSNKNEAENFLDFKLHELIILLRKRSYTIFAFKIAESTEINVAKQMAFFFFALSTQRHLSIFSAFNTINA